MTWSPTLKGNVSMWDLLACIDCKILALIRLSCASRKSFWIWLIISKAEHLVVLSLLTLGRRVSGDTHFLWHFHCLFLLPLHYLPLCYLPLIPFLSDVYNHLWASLSISKHCVEFPFIFVILSPILSFTFPISPLDRLWDRVYLQPLCLFLFSSMFIFIFIFIFISHVTMSYLLFPGS